MPAPETILELPAKRTGETLKYLFDFSGKFIAGASISSASTVATVYSGTDANPSAVVSGSATASGLVVTQTLTAGVAGVIYLVICTAITSGGETSQIAAYLAVI